MIFTKMGMAAAAAALVTGCATAPRGPAGALGKAGDDTAAGIARDTRETAAQIEYADVTEAFVGTWDSCANPQLPCSAYVPSEALSKERNALADVIRLRARAAQALARAYNALAVEADYDAKADLQGATEDAVAGVTTLATAVATLAGPGAAGAQALLAPIGAAARAGAGVFAEQKQRGRILAANRRIAAATERLRDSMMVEQAIFARLADGIGNQRTAARRALLEAGVVSSVTVLKPLTDQLGIALLPTTDATIAKSPRAQVAVEATLKAQSRTEIAAVQSRYALCIEALDELLEGHVELEQAGQVSLSGLVVVLGDLNAELDRYLDGEQ